jgi:hypothetical protein
MQYDGCVGARVVGGCEGCVWVRGLSAGARVVCGCEGWRCGWGTYMWGATQIRLETVKLLRDTVKLLESVLQPRPGREVATIREAGLTLGRDARHRGTRPAHPNPPGRGPRCSDHATLVTSLAEISFALARRSARATDFENEEPCSHISSLVNTSFKMIRGNGSRPGRH